MKNENETLIVIVEDGGALIFYSDDWCVDSTSGDPVGFRVASISLDKENETLHVEMEDRQLFVKDTLGSDWKISSFSGSRYLTYTATEYQNSFKQIEEWSGNCANS